VSSVCCRLLKQSVWRQTAERHTELHCRHGTLRHSRLPPWIVPARMQRHTAGNLCSEMRRVISEWELEEKLVAVVTDNAAKLISQQQPSSCSKRTAVTQLRICCVLHIGLHWILLSSKQCRQLSISKQRLKHRYIFPSEYRCSCTTGRVARENRWDQTKNRWS